LTTRATRRPPPEERRTTMTTESWYPLNKESGKKIEASGCE
jgi:hypothetical protein